VFFVFFSRRLIRAANGSFVSSFKTSIKAKQPPDFQKAASPKTTVKL
jgi:hypothetical protein